VGPSLSKAARYVSMVWACLLGAVLCSYATVGWFSRYVGDDFQTAAYARTKGFWQSQYYWHQNWSGRFSFVFTINLLHVSFGARIVPFVTTVALIVWLLALAGLIFQLFELWGEPQSRRKPFFFAALILVVTVAINGNADVVYWETGVVTYTLPIALFCFMLAAMIYCIRGGRQTSLGSLMFFGVAAVFIGGFSETFATYQTTFFSIALGLALLKAFSAPEIARRLFLAAFLGSVVSLVIVASAPGNQIRMEGASYASLAWVFKSAFLYSFYLIFKFVFVTPLAAASAFALPAVVSFQASAPAKGPAEQPQIAWSNVGKILLMNLAVLIAMTACTVPGFYALGATPPPRALFLPQFLMVAAAVVWGHFVSSALRSAGLFRNWMSAISLIVIALVLALLPITTIKSNLQVVPVAAGYAREWDQQDHEMKQSRSAGKKEIKLHLIQPGPGEKCRLSSDPQDWYNRAVAEYYGVESIEAPESQPKSCD
jgi:uncharacterized membrane protein YiaA